MPISGQTVGRDISLNIVTPNGLLNIPANFITNFDAKPLAQLKKYDPISGIINPLVFHEGWEFEMDIARIDTTLDSFWALLESDYFNGIDVPTSTIHETINESSGVSSQWIYTGIQFILQEAGKYEFNNYVTQKLKGYAARKQQAL